MTTDISETFTRVWDYNMGDADYPALFSSADAASRNSQRAYLWNIGGLLVSLSIIGIIGSLDVDGDTKKYLAIITALLVILNFNLTNIIGENKFEETWFDGRVVAESVKSMTWKYIMCAQPFDIDNSDHIFIEQIKVTNDYYIDRKITPEGILRDRPYITDKMRVLRSLPEPEKRSIYIKSRLEDQMRWYDSKSCANEKSARKWKNGLYAVNSLMMLSAIIVFASPNTTISAVGILSAFAASLISWTQIKKFNELRISYRIAANELNYIINTHQERSNFAEFVSDSENAISREHTNWIARKQGV